MSRNGDQKPGCDSASNFDPHRRPNLTPVNLVKVQLWIPVSRFQVGSLFDADRR